MKELFIDCSTGIAGDMLSAALIELCPDKEATIKALNSLGIPGVEYSIETVQRYGITGSHLSVKYLGMEEEPGCQHEHHHHHKHNGVKDILGIINALNMKDSLKEKVRQVYKCIAEAEAKVHGCDMEHIHFHELGTMDAVADISAVCYLMDHLGAERITFSPVCTGFGSIVCAHGVMPIPAPATAEILKGMPSFAGDTEGELSTPTGTALAKCLASGFGSMPPMTVQAVGYGIGKKDFGKLSAVRTLIGESEETIIELCCNVDDMTSEAIGFAIGELLRHGAPDTYYEPIGMKKNRPGIMLTCLCREQQRDEMVKLIFKHTSTIGIRETLCRRYVLKRREETVTTPYGAVRVKLSDGYGVERKKAEYDDLAKIARDNDLSITQVLSSIIK